MPKKKFLESLTEGQLEAGMAKRIEQKSEELEQQKRERLIAECHEIIGRVQGSSMMAEMGNVASLVWLNQVKESKIYKDVPGVGTWERFCNCTGSSRRKADIDLQNLKVLGEHFLATVASFSVGYRDLRKLRQSVDSGEIKITSESLEINGEKIPFDADHTEDLGAAIEVIVERTEEKFKQKEKKAKDAKKLSDETIKSLEIERDSLVGNIKRLRIFEEKPRSDEDISWCKRQMAEVYKACITFTGLCEKFIVDERLGGDRQRQAEVEGVIEYAQMALRDLNRTWVDQFIPDDELFG